MTKDYDFSKAAGLCCACGKELAPGAELVATLGEAGEEFQRQDYCPGCWDTAGRQQRPELLGVWRTSVPRPEEKKKLFVDDELLVNCIERLEGAEEPRKISFRFVLTLVLMRKKLLVYEGSQKTPDGQDRWTMRRKGTKQTYEVIDPHMDEEKIAEVSRQLGEVLEADL